MQKKLLLTFLVSAFVIDLIITRFINLGWGLPFPFHPDERNMVVALQQFACTSFPTDCFNPHFFAYGQLPLYLGYVLVKIMKLFEGNVHTFVTFEEGALALRFISAFASVFTAYLLVKIMMTTVSALKWQIPKYIIYLASLLFIFSPGLIQFAHFGTTESLLMFFYSAIAYVTLLLQQEHISTRKAYVILSVLIGLAIGTKVSAAVFALLPIFVIISHELKRGAKPIEIFFTLAKVVFGAVLVSFAASPFNFITFDDFLSSIRYESAVGLGQAKVFYTRQFDESLPVIFQLLDIFPYSLGIPVAIAAGLGFIFLPWKKETNLLRWAILSYFIFNAALYTKWTRFMAPIFPLLIVTGVLFLLFLFQKIKRVSIILVFVICLSCIPGLAYLSIYILPDVRIQASGWMAKNITPESKVVQEGGNVIDLPLGIGNFPNISVDLYNLDTDPIKADEFASAVSQADYIIIPSRRVFANQTCYDPASGKLMKRVEYASDHCSKLLIRYPAVNQFYGQLFTGKLGYKEVARFDPEPSIAFMGMKILSISDEQAEETWSVFDHPTIRIYKRM